MSPVRRNFEIRPHADGNNKGASWGGIGDFTGGGIWALDETAECQILAFQTSIHCKQPQPTQTPPLMSTQTPLPPPKTSAQASSNGSTAKARALPTWSMFECFPYCWEGGG